MVDLTHWLAEIGLSSLPVEGPRLMQQSCTSRCAGVQPYRYQWVSRR